MQARDKKLINELKATLINLCMALRFIVYPDWHCVPESALSNLSIANLPVTQPLRCTCFAVAMQNDGIATSTILITKLFESRTSSPAGIWLHESALHATQQQLMTYYGASEQESARQLTQWTYNCVKFDFAGQYRVLVCSPSQTVMLIQQHTLCSASLSPVDSGATKLILPCSYMILLLHTQARAVNYKLQDSFL
jgi:hypothetical protein